MRGDDAVFKPQQRIIRADGFHAGHIHRRAGYLAAKQRIAQGFFVDQLAAGGIHDHHAVLHAGDGFAVDELFIVFSQRTVQADYVALCNHLIQRKLPFAAVSAACQHLHAKGVSNVCHGLSDAPIADHAQRFAGKLCKRIIPETEVTPVRPAALLHGGVVCAHMVAQFQQQRKSVLRHRHGAVGGYVGDHNAALTGGLHIHHIIARRQHAYVANLRAGGKGLRSDRRFVGDNNFRIANAGDDFIRRRVLVYGQIAQRGKAVPAQIAGVFGISIQNHDFHRPSSGKCMEKQFVVIYPSSFVRTAGKRTKDAKQYIKLKKGDIYADSF